MDNYLTTLNKNIQDAMPGFMFHKALYPTMSKQQERVFETRFVQRHTEYSVGKQMMGEAMVTQDGQQAPYGTFQNYGQKSFNFPYYTLQVNISRMYLQDNLYREVAPQLGVAFLQSMIEAVNLEVAAFFRRGFEAQGNIGLDGKTLYATDHPTLKGNVSNTINAAAMFNYSTFYQMLINMWRFRAKNGFYAGNMMAKIITCPPELTANIFVILESQFSPSTSSFAINAARGMKWISDGVQTNPYIAKNSVMIRTNLPGMYMFVRWPFDISQMPNISTFSLLTSCFMRFGLDYDDFRSSLGLQMPLSSENYI